MKKMGYSFLIGTLLLHNGFFALQKFPMQPKAYQGPSEEVKNFVAQLKEYYPDCNWVIQELQKMSLADFSFAWGVIIARIKNRDTRFFYLYNQRDMLKEDEVDAYAFTEQFRGFCNHFEKIAVDVEKEELYTFEKPFKYGIKQFVYKGRMLMPLLEYWQQKNPALVYDFFAMHFKDLAILFDTSIKRGNDVHSIEDIAHAINYFKELYTIYCDYLSKSKYDNFFLEKILCYDSLIRCAGKEYDKKNNN